jgi:hypothetical protein
VWPHPTSYCELIDADGLKHLISLFSISRISVAGTEAAPEVELWILFGGTVWLSGEHAKTFPDLFRRWGRLIDP